MPTHRSVVLTWRYTVQWDTLWSNVRLLRITLLFRDLVSHHFTFKKGFIYRIFFKPLIWNFMIQESRYILIFSIEYIWILLYFRLNYVQRSSNVSSINSIAYSITTQWFNQYNSYHVYVAKSFLAGRIPYT